MSVIGRLDDQTRAILITPLEKRSRRSPHPEAAQDERTPGGVANPSHTDRRTPDDERSSSDQAARPAELPVWLL
jgi:hypothetical protein